MRLPENAPTFQQIIERIRIERLIPYFNTASPLHNRRYLHWDELRYRASPDGLSRDEWWAAILLGRRPLLQNLPLLDKSGNEFKFATPSPVLIHLHHIDRDAAGHLHSTIGAPIKDDPNRYLLSSLIEEAITSSQLEGASTTRQVAAAMLREGRKPRDHSETMIHNNYLAMEHLRSLKQHPITPDLILELHRMLTEDTLDDPADTGRLRQTDDVQVVDNRDAVVLHAPPTYTELPARLERLCAFANANENSLPFVHPVLRAILLHFMIGYDHPFADGNGRTARALFYWSMARSGYWLMEYASISHFLRKGPASYTRAYLHTETDQNDTTYFLLHQLGTIRRSIVALHDYLTQKGRDQKETEKMLSASPNLRARFNHRQIALLTHALRHTGEGYRVDVHMRSHNVVYQTARNDLLDLHSLGLLDRAQKGNAYVFFAPKNLRDRLSAFANSISSGS